MLKKCLLIVSSFLLFFACENGTESGSESNNTNTIIDISSLGIDTHQDNEYYSDTDTHQYEFDIWKSGVSGYFQCAIFYTSDPSITIPENGTYTIDNNMDSEGDFSFYYLTSSKYYNGMSGTVIISNSDSVNGTYTITVNNLYTIISDSSSNIIGDATFTGSIDVLAGP